MSAIRLLALVEANTTTGPAKNLLQFADCLRAEADPPMEIAFAVFRRAGVKNLFIDTARDDSIKIYPIEERRAFDAEILPQLHSAVRDFRPDIIQSHSVKSHFLVRFARLHRRAPWVAFHHGYTWPSWRMRLYNQLDRWSLRGARLVLTVSLPFKRELVGFGVAPDRIEVAHNAINPDWGLPERTPEARTALRAALGITVGEKVLLIVGRLSREKDHGTLLHAVYGLLHFREPFSVRLLIVGDGPERSAIQETIRRLGLSDAVILTGQVPSAAPYYGIADVAVLSSLSEGSPNALLEAMATRVPIVATSVGGIPEIVSHDRTALLVPPADADAMTRALAAVLADQALARRLADEAHELLLSGYSPVTRTRHLLDCYSALL